NGKLVGKRPALQDSVYVDVGWTAEPRLALFRSGSFDPAATGGSAEVEDLQVAFEDFSTSARMIDQAHEETEGPSIEDADVIVAINKDTNAPIFEFSDLGVVGDVHEVVPKLTELVKQRKGS